MRKGKLPLRHCAMKNYEKSFSHSSSRSVECWQEVLRFKSKSESMFFMRDLFVRVSVRKCKVYLTSALSLSLVPHRQLLTVACHLKFSREIVYKGQTSGQTRLNSLKLFKCFQSLKWWSWETGDGREEEKETQLVW